ncbi:MULTISPECIES: hypothetical protein [Natrialba]|uniref:Uncharacterized protein n=1 Tax=Natrialba aegyptia DSM 13077 TaxID=1227491 RepID=M0AN95_9EURY|nr:MULTISPECIES: hypothetical protein [Natrialba]ELY99979.1 hypothetical protein C480_19539 [Natrialba aegyptia DSM 13077]OIB57377.1 hypothetical protein BBD46_02535 [Natrialba sp. SSL1]
MSLPERENELLSTLQAIIDAGHPYVLVGGWAVTAFNQRFSTDVDLVIPEMALEEYESFLAEHGYEQTNEYDTSALYEGRFIQFSKDVGNPVSIELLVNALRCRQTDAEWSYRYLTQHSQPATVGRTLTVDAQIPEQELLLAIKLHSGRLTDIRDVIAAATDADFDRVETHLHRGNPRVLSTQLEGILEQMADEGFIDAFKGEFQQKTIPEDDIKRVRRFLRDQQDRLE